MKKILIIGIGAGDPEYITMQAVNALNEVDVFFIMDKGPAKTKLIELRKEICRRYDRRSRCPALAAWRNVCTPRPTSSHVTTADGRSPGLRIDTLRRLPRTEAPSGV